MLILGDNYIFCAPNVVNFLYDFFNWQHGLFKYLVASHVTEPDSWLPNHVL